MKILSPAGNFESLKMAIFNGADEVYLGINNFNARNNIDGFNLDNIGSAVDFAHLHNVKINLAINILFADNELQSALDTIVSAYNLGVDCFIVQDLGLAKLVHEIYPEIELHASTQMAIHNLEGVEAILKYGFKRIVLARETSLEEVKRIKQAHPDIEIEYFCQGALCVAFSGNCYLSSYLNNASGNRGKCKQLCRLPYTLLKNNTPVKQGYLLSAKDFNMIDRLDDLKNVGVDVLKIEGRARRPYYVAVATKQYYNALHHKQVNQEELKLAFNRNYTPGYLDGNADIISNYQAHIGVPIGKVEKVLGGKRFNEVFFTSNRKLYPKSTFKTFENGKEQSTISAYDLSTAKNNLYRLTTTQPVKVGNQINLIVDANHEAEVLSKTVKRKIDITLNLQQNAEIKTHFEYNNRTLEITGDVLQPANNHPVTLEELKENFSKSEYFDTNIIVEKLDYVFIPKKDLNEFRRTVFDTIYKTITDGYKHNLPNTQIHTNKQVIKFVDFQFVENLNETFTKQNIIYSPEEYTIDNVLIFVNKCKKSNKTPYLDTPNFATHKDIELLKDIVAKSNIAIIANNYYAISITDNYVVGGGLNVYNTITANEYNKPVITAESNISTKHNFAYMTLRHCPFKNHLKANCANCPYTNTYSLKMESGKVLKLKRKKLETCTFYLTD